MKYIWFWHPSILGTSLTSLPDLRICFLVGGATSTWWTGFGGDLSRRRKGWCVGGGYPVFFGKGRQPDLTPPPSKKKYQKSPEIKGPFFLRGYYEPLVSHGFPKKKAFLKPNFWGYVREMSNPWCLDDGQNILWPKHIREVSWSWSLKNPSWFGRDMPSFFKWCVHQRYEKRVMLLTWWTNPLNQLICYLSHSSRRVIR